MRKETRGDQGVTLVGPVLVILILAVLVTGVLLVVGSTTERTRHEPALASRAAFASCRSTVAGVKAALQVYRAERATGSYPATLANLAVATGQANGPVLKQAPQTAAGPLAHGASTSTQRMSSMRRPTESHSGSSGSRLTARAAMRRAVHTQAAASMS